MKFRKKPIIVEAEQFFDGKPARGVYGGFPYQRKCIACLPEKNYDVHGPAVITVHGQVTQVSDGDWIIDEGDGLHFYPCKPDIFEKTYETVETTTNPNPGPDPAAVRDWLNEIDKCKNRYDRDEIKYPELRITLAVASQWIVPAARAWLAQQDALDSRPFHWTSH